MDGLDHDEGWTLERLRDAVVPPSGLVCCSGPPLHGLLAAAVDDAGPGPFGAVARTPSFLRGLERMLDELALGSVSSSTLAEAAERMGPSGARLLHLARIVECALERMATARVERPSFRWVPAAAELARGWPARLRVEHLELTLGPPCPPGVVGFVAALARALSASG